ARRGDGGGPPGSGPVPPTLHEGTLPRRPPRPGHQPEQPGGRAAVAGGLRPGRAAAPRRPGHAPAAVPPRALPRPPPPPARPAAPARAPTNLGLPARRRGEPEGATPAPREALALRRKLFTPERYPEGHPDLATSLNNLGFVLQARGEYGRAEPLYQEVLAM